MSAEFTSEPALPSRSKKRMSNGVAGSAKRRPQADEGADLAPRHAHPVLELRALAARLEQERGSKSLRASFAEWFTREVTENGLLRRDPAATPDALAELLQIRKRAGKRRWSDALDASTERMFAATCQMSAEQSSLLGEGTLPAEERPILSSRALEKLKDFRPWSTLLAATRSGVKPSRQDRRRAPLGLECDDSRVALLRNDWLAVAPQVGVDFSQSACRLDLRVVGRPLIRGYVSTTLRVDGREIEPAPQWENIGWNVDQSGQYLEIKQELGSGITLERVLFLSLDAPMLLWIDVARVPGGGRIRLDVEWPLAEEGEWNAVGSTRAWAASGLGFDARVLPISLPAGQTEPSPGQLSARAGHIHSSIEQTGVAVASASILTWSRKKIEGEPRWRGLTITQDRRLVAPTEAVAFRANVDGKSVVIHRSLVGTRRFAFVGHQTFYETLVGQYNAKKRFVEWLAVDADPDTPWDQFATGTHHHQHTTHTHPSTGHAQ